MSLRGGCGDKGDRTQLVKECNACFERVATAAAPGSALPITRAREQLPKSRR